MELSLESGRSIANPNTSEIQAALSVHASSGGGFAILSRDKLTYIQLAGDADSGFLVEYQDGDTDRHFRCEKERVPLDDAIRAFQSYAVGDEKWRTMFAWVKLEEADFRPARGCMGAAAAIIVAAVAGTFGIGAAAALYLR